MSTTSLSEIKFLLANGKAAEAISLLDKAMASEPANDVLIYLRGKSYWQMGEKAKAISDYESAAQLNPQSPAVHALEMSRDIMDFFNPDIFNP